jgi:hypothetical protein
MLRMSFDPEFFKPAGLPTQDGSLTGHFTHWRLRRSSASVKGSRRGCSQKVNGLPCYDDAGNSMLQVCPSRMLALLNFEWVKRHVG